MAHGILRVALVVLALAVQGGAGFYIFHVHQQTAALRSAWKQVDRQVSRVQALVHEARAAQATMVVPGQDVEYWRRKAGALLQDGDAVRRQVERPDSTPEVLQDLGVSGESIAALGQMTARIQELLVGGQPAAAAAVVVGDAAQTAGSVVSALDRVRTALAAASDAAAAEASRQQLYALGAAVVVTFVVLGLLVPRVGPDASSTALASSGLNLSSPVGAIAEIDALGRNGLDFELGTSPPPAPEPPRESEAALAEALQRETQLGLNAEPAVDLAGASQLCGDLARVRDSAGLEALLERITDLLGASGIVVWLRSEGSRLRPAFSHGYSDHALAKMGSLRQSDENAVAASFRSGRQEVVVGSGSRNGALVSPIVGASGCVGVLAAEIRGGGETATSVKALAAIIAALVAALVGEPGQSGQEPG